MTDVTLLSLCANSHNQTNHSVHNVSMSAEPGLAEVSVLAPGCVIFLLSLPILLFEFRGFPLGTVCASLLAATMMVTTQVVSVADVYDVIGRRDHLTCVSMLLGTLLMSQYYEREQVLTKLLRRILRPSMSLASYVWRVSLLSFILSALFSNDTCCAILTPLLFRFWEVQERPKSELEIVALAIATSSNIGSVVTIFGNPHLAIIASRTNIDPYTASRLDLRRSLLYLGPPAILAFLMNFGFLLLLNNLKTRAVERAKMRSLANHRLAESRGSKAELAHMNGGVHIIGQDGMFDTALLDSRNHVLCTLETIIEDEVLEITSTSTRSVSLHDSDCMQLQEPPPQDSSSSEDSEDEEAQSTTSDRLNTLDIDYKPCALQSQSQNLIESVRQLNSTSPHRQKQGGLALSDKVGIYRSLSAVSCADFLSVSDVTDSDHSSSQDLAYTPSDSILFQIFLCLVTLLVFILLLSSTPHVQFDIGMVCVGSAALVIVADTLLNRRSASLMLKRVDWSVLLMFMAIFVWMEGFNKTQLPRWIWHKLGLSSGLLHPLSMLVFTCISVPVSNIISPVPLTLMVLDQLSPCPVQPLASALPGAASPVHHHVPGSEQGQLPMVLMLAWVTTIAGNVSLFGSVANVIVCQKARSTLGYRLSFFKFLRYGALSTLFTLPAGMLVIYALLQI